MPSDFLYICYEDDIDSDAYNGYKKVMEYLGYRPKTIATKLRKTNPQKLSEIIENYEAVRNYLKDTPYYWMVDT